MRFFTSDTHFRHKNIIAYDQRPFESLEEMEESIIAAWNIMVSKNDIVFHLGDIAFAKPSVAASIIGRLNGKITLIRGNHDIRNGYTFERCAKVSPKMFHDIADIKIIKIGEKTFVLSHYPYEDPYFGALAPHMFGYWLIHGHSHVGVPRVIYNYEKKMINVNCCLWDYHPVPENVILDIVNNPDKYKAAAK